MLLSDFIKESKNVLEIYGDLELISYSEKDETWYSPSFIYIGNAPYIKGKFGIDGKDLPEEFLTIDVVKE